MNFKVEAQFFHMYINLGQYHLLTQISIPLFHYFGILQIKLLYNMCLFLDSVFPYPLSIHMPNFTVQSFPSCYKQKCF